MGSFLGGLSGSAPGRVLVEVGPGLRGPSTGRVTSLESSGVRAREGGATYVAPPWWCESVRQINVTERLLVVSVRVSDVNWTVIGGLQSGENVAVAVSV
jgi:hypothetical protein